MVTQERLLQGARNLKAKGYSPAQVDSWLQTKGSSLDEMKIYAADVKRQQFEKVQPTESPVKKEQLMQGLRKDAWDNRLGAVTKFDQGASFGLGKKLGGIANSVFSAPIDWWAGALGYETPSRLDRYNEIVQPAVQAGKRFEEQHPVGSVALEMAGSLANPANYLGAGMVANTAKFLPKLGKAGVLGAATGAADTLGRYNSVDEVLENIGTDAALGSAVNLAFPAAGGLLGGLGRGARGLLGLTTGTGSALNAAYDAGKRNSSVFLQNMRGGKPLSEVVDSAKDFYRNIKDKQLNAYNLSKGSIAEQSVPFSPVRLSYDNLLNENMLYGVDTAPEGVRDVLNKAGKIIEQYEKEPKTHTVRGLDALKQQLGGINVGINDRPALRARTKLYNSVKDSISEASPEYKKVMSDYEGVQNSLSEFEKELGLGWQKNPAQSLRKLQKAFRNDAVSSYGNNAKLIESLEGDSKKITDALAGQVLNDWRPRGLSGNLSALGSGLGAFSNPLALLGLAASSPRLMGEVAYWSGRGASTLDNLAKGLNPAGLAMPLSAAFAADNY